ncbi:MAG TPA: HEAT repeat domain-containing protein [Terriglobales bacterium]|nr:HEAT repeat domain-containing protein [Terriglobales bacterium]
MSKADPIETALNKLGELRQAAQSQSTVEELHQFLRHRSNLVVAKAAKLGAELRATELIPELAAAFGRFMSNAKQKDKRCAAVTEIAKALYEFDYLEPNVYLQGIHHVQLEASFGPPVDTAATLRGICAQGLLRTRHPNAMAEVLPLLVDTEPAARIGAVRAFAVHGGNAGILILRLKALTNDPEPDVLVECFSGLLSAALDDSLKFVAGFMDAEDSSVSEAAMWALGQSRSPAAFACLKEKWDKTITRSLRKTLMAAMAASRCEEANLFLCSIIAANEHSPDAVYAFEALSTYKSRESIREAVAEVSWGSRASAR